MLLFSYMELSKTYNPKEYESKIYDLWEQNKVFEPSKEGRPFSMVFPPPNANGNLHIGHAFTLAIQDIAARYARLKGDSVLFVPGADHAGFETQVVYERLLEKEGKSRFDFSREELYSQIYDYVNANKNNTENQLKKLGASFDWSKHVFSLDKKVVDSAYKRFKKMWDDKLIYRGERLVNFCTLHGTAFADIEVEYKEEQGHLWYVNYPVNGADENIVVATTRPETLLGDTAVAVNPNDKRYSKLINKTVTLPLTGREVPIIADDFVDPDFGTGAVKITPAHDPNDFEAASRHSLPMISVIDFMGNITHEMPEKYRGLDVLTARNKVLKDLKDQGFLSKTEDYTHSVGHCYKCKTIIQPLLKEQWFIDMKPLAKKAVEVLRDNKIVFYPESKKTQLINYLNQLRDWNISRQISWGIPIPAFQNTENPDDWIFDSRVEQELIETDNKTYKRDPDVFDTWFSSSSWPYVATDYPDSDLFKKYYPLSLMDTGGEILFPWVSRMIMLGLYETGEIPFKEVYIHGYVMAEDGAKMSKSLGNVINPIDVVDEYGSDALRMGMIAGRVPGVNRGYDPRKVEDARNFCNKLWNIARFSQDKISSYIKNPKPKTMADNWIIGKLDELEKNLAKDMDRYGFAEGHEKLYHFIWDDLADWYVEASKSQSDGSILAYVLVQSLKLLHPYAPFVTEAIWQSLKPVHESEILGRAKISTIIEFDRAKSKKFETVKDLIVEIRNISNTMKLTKRRLVVKPSQIDKESEELIKKLARVGEILDKSFEEEIQLTNTDIIASLEVSREVLIGYLSDLKSKISESKKIKSGLEGRLKNRAYIEKAPEKLVKETRDSLVSINKSLELLEGELTKFKS